MAKLSEETVVIKRDKVYTSYYARACKIVPDWKLVAISIGIPDNFGGEIYRQLNPSKSLLYDYKHNDLSEEEYTQRYFNDILSNLDAEQVYKDMAGKVMCCYCGKDSFCHRKLVLDWLEQKLGSEIIGGEI